MAKDVKIYDGSDWQSIKGPKGDDGAKGDAGVPGPTAVSTDANNVVELGADGLLKLDPAKLDSRFVNVTGDTMTGQLIVNVPSQSDITGQLQVYGERIANVTLTGSGDPSNGGGGPAVNFRTRRSRGTLAAPQEVASGDILFTIATQAYFNGAYRPSGNIQYRVDDPQAGDTTARTRVMFATGSGTVGGELRMVIDSQGFVGINFLDPTHQLEVQGDTMLRGPLEVTGDTTTTGNISTAGFLTVKPAVGPAVPKGSIQVIGDNTTAAITVERNADTNGHPSIRLRRTRGTTAAPTPQQAGDGMGAIAWHGLRADGATNAGAGYILVNCTKSPVAGENQAHTEMRFAVGRGIDQLAVLTLTPEGTSTPKVETFALTSPNGILKSDVPVEVQIDSATPYPGVYVERPNGIGIQSIISSTDGITPVYGLYTEMVATARAGCPLSVALVGHNYGGADVNYGLWMQYLPVGPNNWSIYSSSAAKSYIAGNLGLNWTTPTHQLEVSGDTMLRGPLEVTGNITSAGAAHSFAAGSIPAPAVIGGTASTPTAGTAAAAGSMRWDENFLYIRTGTAWKKVALTAL